MWTLHSLEMIYVEFRSIVRAQHDSHLFIVLNNVLDSHFFKLLFQQRVCVILTSLEQPFLSFEKKNICSQSNMQFFFSVSKSALRFAVLVGYYL